MKHKNFREMCIFVTTLLSLENKSMPCNFSYHNYSKDLIICFSSFRQIPKLYLKLILSFYSIKLTSHFLS